MFTDHKTESGGIILGSSDFYTKFSDNYHKYVNSKKDYLNAVDLFIKSEINHCDSLVDVGTGDGKRVERLCHELRITNITLIDNSRGMIELARKIPNVEVIFADIANQNFISTKTYNTVLCLWNVIGHISTSEKRVIALRNLAKLAGPEGEIFLDVNNRYNISNYGVISVFRNIFKDFFYPTTGNGDFLVDVGLGNNRIRTMGHIFNPNEIENLFIKSGLKIIKRKIINYKTGCEGRNVFGGQLVYRLSIFP